MDSGAGAESASFLSGKTVDEFIKNVMVEVRNCQRGSGELQGWQHYRDYSGVQTTMEEVNHRLVSLISSIFAHGDVKLKLRGHKLVDQFDLVREGSDALHERINSDIDEAAGLKKQMDLDMVDTSIKTVKIALNKKTSSEMVLIASRNVQKPQLFFQEKVDNSKKRPFLPLLEDKPNSMKPLSMIICINEDGREYLPHPYLYELQHWNVSSTQLEKTVPTQPLPLEDAPLIKIETEEALAEAVQHIRSCAEFAVDLEHHSFRSYLGLTCLIQISTRTMDYIIDPLALRGKLTILNEVFTNPKITKVIHGSDYDVLWLQRDCGIYLVNMFDTHQAAVVLEYPHRSLAALLYSFCSIEANKAYQRADWRIRPLPDDFIEYARQDTHYLLYIYDKLRNELIEKGNEMNNLLNAVYNRSLDLCMKRYEKPHIGNDGHLDMYRKSRKMFNTRRMFALKSLFIWRDGTARDHDESPDFVLPKHMMLQIAEVLPKETQGILACCNPIPPLVKTELLTLHNLIRTAREQQLDTVDLSDKYVPIPTEVAEDLTALLLSKHDLSLVEENAINLPTLLNPHETLLGDLFNQPKVPIKSQKRSKLYGCLKKEQQVSEIWELKTQEYISPFERYVTYLEMKPMLEDERNRKAETTDIARLNRVRMHLAALQSATNNSDISSPTNQAFQDNIDRINRVKLHLKNMTTSDTPGYTPGTKERVDRVRDHFLSFINTLRNAPDDSFTPTRENTKVSADTTDGVESAAAAGESNLVQEEAVGSGSDTAETRKVIGDAESIIDGTSITTPKRKKKKKKKIDVLSIKELIEAERKKKRKSKEKSDDSPSKKLKVGDDDDDDGDDDDVDDDDGAGDDVTTEVVPGLISDVGDASVITDTINRDDNNSNNKSIGQKNITTNVKNDNISSISTDTTDVTLNTSDTSVINDATSVGSTGKGKRKKLDKETQEDGATKPKNKKNKKSVGIKESTEDEDKDLTNNSTTILDTNLSTTSQSIDDTTSSNTTTEPTSSTSSDPQENTDSPTTQSPEATPDTTEGTNETTGVTPFDYDKADFSVFKKKKKDKQNKKGGKFEGKFKGASQKSKGFKKSGLKSFTWGSGGSKSKNK